METATALSGEHAEDVLKQLRDWQLAGEVCALVCVTSTQGGAVRAPGALLAVSSTETIGYISGGCIDADVALQARVACETNTARELRYGAGSPFVDLPLPCGGAIEVLIVPSPEKDVITEAYTALAARKQLELVLSQEGELKVRNGQTKARAKDYVFAYAPKLRVRIAGRGADALALATMSAAAGYDTHLQVVDPDDVQKAQTAGLESIEVLDTPSELTHSGDDAWTAFVLLFHDQDWEIPLLLQALGGPAFYIGAVGSQRTHDRRGAAMKAAGCSEDAIARVYGPIGLVSSLRDASMLAISVLAEIVDCFPGKASARLTRTAYLMLAAGASSRFEDGDKLLAKLNGDAILARASAARKEHKSGTNVAVTRPKSAPRRKILESNGWRVVENAQADQGQAESIKCGLDEILQDPEIDQVIILLGDMPFVPGTHLKAMCQRAEVSSVTAIMSEANGVLSPPALFKRAHFDALRQLSGDRGAKALFMSLDAGAETIPLSLAHAVDIDHVADITELEENLNA